MHGNYTYGHIHKASHKVHACMSYIDGLIQDLPPIVQGSCQPCLLRVSSRVILWPSAGE